MYKKGNIKIGRIWEYGKKLNDFTCYLIHDHHDLIIGGSTEIKMLIYDLNEALRKLEAANV